jgi:uncharacterized membrane protein YqjE
MQIVEQQGTTPGPFNMLSGLMMTLGGLFVAAGILIVLFPAILVALVAGCIVVAGLGLIGSGWRMRKLQQDSTTFTRIEVIDPNPPV